MKNKQLIPEVSIIMAAYNRELYIGESIRSLLAQSFINFELIIVDDGSTDSTKTIIKQFQKKDKRIVLISQKNQGVTSARTAGIDHARADLIAIADSDDLSQIDRLEKELNEFRKDAELVVCGSSFDQIDENGKHLDSVGVALSDSLIKLEMYFRCPFGHSTTMLRKSTLLSAGGYRKELYAEDYDLWSRLKEQGRFKNLAGSLCRYRVHGSSISANVSAYSLRNVIDIKNNLWKKPPETRLMLSAFFQSRRQQPRHLSFVLSSIYIEAKSRKQYRVASVAAFLRPFVGRKYR